MTTENRKSTKRSIRWDNVDQLDVIQSAVDILNETGQPGQRVTFNNFVADASFKAACELYNHKPKRTPK